MTGTETLTVLVIEDNPRDAELVEEMFVQADREGLLAQRPATEDVEAVDVRWEETLESGLERASTLGPDIVLLDLQLPDSDGFETVERTLSEVTQIPVVVLTGMPEEQLGLKAVSSGAQDYLVKDDITPDGLAMSVQYALERKKTERQLRRQSHQLAILNQLTRHDIKNDISLIVGRAEELTEYVDPRGQDLVEDIIQAGNHVLQLTRTIGDALDTMTEEDRPELTAIELNRVIRAEAEKAQSLYGDAEITVGDVPDVEVLGNKLLASVFGNLISNGVFFNDKKTPEIHIDGATDGDTVTVRVADNGPGVPRQQQDQIFSEGVQSAESAGMGVGLALVNRLVTQYDGEVWVEDNDPEGSIFCVRLLCADADEPS